MKEFKIIWLGVFIFVFFYAPLGNPYDKNPAELILEEGSNTCLCRGDIDHNGVINRHDEKLMYKVIQGEIKPPLPLECGDLNYNGIPYEIADYVILKNWVSQHHAIQCKKQKLTLASLKISEIQGKPCDKINLPVFIQNDMQVAAFDLQIEFNPTLLYFKGVERGEALTIKDSTGTYQWEYLTYRQLPIFDPFLYRLEIFGVFDYKDNHTGIPLQPDTNFVELAKIKFQITCDNNLLGIQIPVNFFWNPKSCTENSLSDQSGTILYVSNDTSQFNFIDCDTNIINSEIIPSVNFNNGFVNITELPGAQIGDINLNGVPYEIGDATLFANYFTQGLSVFTIDQGKQIAVSDIDRNRTFLTLSDFLLLIRIMQGKASPGDSTGISDKVVYWNSSIRDSVLLISLNSEVPIGAALFSMYYSKISGTPYIVSTNMDLIYKAENSELMVLIYSFKNGVNIPAGALDLLTIPHYQDVGLVNLQAVDDMGRVLKVRQGTTGISDQSTQDLPKTFTLFPNYPNPFNPDTYIEYALPSNCQVTLVIYNILGQKVRTLINSYQDAGFKSVRWNGEDDSGDQVSAGVYFYSIKADNFSQTKKMLLLK
jgi:hypothetical protein